MGIPIKTCLNCILALAQGRLHTLSPMPLVEIDEGEGEGDVEGVGSARSSGPFTGLEGYHEVHPGGRPLGFEALDEVSPKDLAEQGLKGHVNPHSSIQTTL